MRCGGVALALVVAATLCGGDSGGAAPLRAKTTTVERPWRTRRGEDEQVHDVPVPSQAHLAFHEDTFGVIIHFNYQTFLDPSVRSQADAPLDPAKFRPSDEQFTNDWMSTAQEMGAKYAVYVADHFSGFSPWPSTVSDFSVKGSPWRFGRGNVVKDFIHSAKTFGLRPGVFFSFHNDWNYEVHDFSKEPMTNMYELARFGELVMQFDGEVPAQIWLDAGLRMGEPTTDAFDGIMRHMNNASCHSCDQSPHSHSVSWMGNEMGYMPYPNWGSQNPTCSDRSSTHYGSANGTRYCPSHCDSVLNQHVWWWQNYTNDVRYTTPQLLAIYFTSVGRGCNLILNIGPDPSGFIPDADRARYLDFGQWRFLTFENPAFEWPNLDHIPTPFPNERVVSFPLPNVTMSRVGVHLREDLTHGQLIAEYVVSYTNTSGAEVALGTLSPQQTIGNHRFHMALDGIHNAVEFSVTFRYLRNTAGAEGRIKYMSILDWSDRKFDAFVDEVHSKLSTLPEYSQERPEPWIEES